MSRHKILFLSLVILLTLATALLHPMPAQSKGADAPTLQYGSNDFFANASEVLLNQAVGGDLSYASLEPGEPVISQCSSGFNSSLWYKFTATETATYTASLSNTWSSVCVEAYSGTELASLTRVEISDNSGAISSFRAEPGVTYYIQVGGSAYWWGTPFSLTVAPTQPPVVDNLWYFVPGYYGSIVSTFDTVYFYLYVSDPAAIGVTSVLWDFGDGVTSTEGNYPAHRYTKDGDYTVKVTITTADGRTGSGTTTVPVRTHDVAISRFTLPGNVRVGQMRTVEVYLQNTRYTEHVTVELCKSSPTSWGGCLTQTIDVPVLPSNQYTKVIFNVPFTAEDAALGSVNFRAVVTLLDDYGYPMRDAIDADNTAISLPVKVRK